MNADTIITMLLIVAAIVAGLMAYVARQQIPGQAEYQPRSRTTSGSSSDRFSYRPEPRSSYRHRSGDGLGRGDDPRPSRRHSGLGRDAEPRHRRADDNEGLGRGYGSSGSYGHDDRRERPRYHANGSEPRGWKGAPEDGPDHGFEAWARANGFRWSDASSRSEPPPPPPPPAAPHWSRVLDIPRNSGVAEIRKAYAKVMRSLHPDVAVQDAFTSQRCTDARIAYEAARRDAIEAGRP